MKDIVSDHVEVHGEKMDLPLYLLNDYLREFDARIIEIKKKESCIGIVLDKTAFYPGGGHQVHDTGELIGRNFRFRVTKIEKRGDKIIHLGEIIEGSPENIALGEIVRGVIDWERRYHIMKLHTAEHIFMHFMEKERGIKLRNGQFGPLEGMIILEKPVELDAILTIEKKVNEVIKQSLPVRRIIRNGIAEIAIKGLGSKKCGGTHVKNTGEIEFFKILKVHGGKVIWYNVSKRAIEELREEYNNLIKIGEILDVTQLESSKISNKLRTILKELEGLKSTVNALSEIIVNAIIKKRMKVGFYIDGERWIGDIVDLKAINIGGVKELEPIMKKLSERLEPNYVVIIQITEKDLILIVKRQKKVVRRIREVITQIVSEIGREKVVISGLSGATLLTFSTNQDLEKFLSKLFCGTARKQNNSQSRISS
ncbi:MAG: alanine--tRNA ligase-related protein [Candidatus Njordarchaeales archaeon]